MFDPNNSQKKAIQENPAAPIFDSVQTGSYPQEQSVSTAEDVVTEPIMQKKSHANVPQPIGNMKRKRRDKPLITFGLVCMALFIAGLIFSDSSAPDTSDAAKKALKDKISTTLAAGAILLSQDENIGEQDYTLTHAQTDQNSTKIWIWDYAAEDGDYVQVLVNGVPQSAPFMIKHKPVLFDLSITGLVGQVQVKGVRDGGGGITYAVHYELNKTTYFNYAPEGAFNTYTLEITPNP